MIIRRDPAMPQPEDPRVVSLAAALGVPVLIARMLVQRNIETPDAAQKFLEPQFGDLQVPGNLPHMSQAIDLIDVALAAGETIAVFGDYDCDGICATALLCEALEACGGRALPLLPSRYDGGYGLSEGIVEQVVQAGAKCLITVDNGISAHDAIAAAKNQGLTVIVADHHVASETLPNADIILHPVHFGGDSPLCAAGLAWKMGWALCGEEWAREWIDVAAVATVGDMVPLVYDNRRLVQLGLAKLAKSPNLGLKSLLDAAGEKSAPTERTLGFGLAPRLNAQGRMGDISEALDLLREKDSTRCRDMAAALDAINTARMAAQRAAVDAALEAVQDQLQQGAKGLCVRCADGQQGVIGLVASKLSKQFYRPTIALCRDNHGEWVGSARSLPGIELLPLLEQCREHLQKFGGHAAAAGMTLSGEDPEAFEAAFAAACQTIPPEHLVPFATVCEHITAADCTLELARTLAKLGPYGQGNAKPLLGLCSTPGKLTVMGRTGEHLRMECGGMTVVAFGFARHRDCIEASQSVEMAVEIQEDTFRGEHRLQLMLNAFCPVDPPITRQTLGDLWRHIAKLEGPLPMGEDLFGWSAAGLATIAEIFCQIGVLRREPGGFLPTGARGKLEASPLFVQLSGEVSA